MEAGSSKAEPAGIMPYSSTGSVAPLQVTCIVEHEAGLAGKLGTVENVKSSACWPLLKHELLDDDPTVRTGVVPPDPQPVESYIVATNCNPDGWVRSKV